MANILLGTDLMLFKDNKALAVATSCKFTISANAMDISNKDSGKWTSKKAGKLSWNASSDNLFILEEYTTLVGLMTSRTEVDIQFSTVSNPDKADDADWAANSDGYEGKAIITSIDVNANDGETATYTVQFEGTGALTEVKA